MGIVFISWQGAVSSGCGEGLRLMAGFIAAGTPGHGIRRDEGAQEFPKASGAPTKAAMAFLCIREQARGRSKAHPVEVRGCARTLLHVRALIHAHCAQGHFRALAGEADHQMSDRSRTKAAHSA